MLLCLGGCAHAPIEQLIIEGKSAQALEIVRASTAPPPDDPGYSKALFEASYHGEEQIVRALLERGADVAALNPRGMTALMLALHYDTDGVYRDVALLLLEHGADVNQRSTLGLTALHFACRREADPSEVGDKIALVELLLERGADASARSQTGATPLFFAAYDAEIEILRAAPRSRRRSQRRGGRGPRAIRGVGRRQSR